MEASAAMDPTTPNGKLVLVVDDEPGNLNLVARLLHGRFQVQLAEGGQAALDALRAPAGADIAIVLCDSRMPGVSGSEVLAAAARERPDAVAVLLTAYPDIDALVSAVNRGSLFRYLSKPVERDLLLSTLTEAAELHERRIQYRRVMERVQRHQTPDPRGPADPDGGGGGWFRSLFGGKP